MLSWCQLKCARERVKRADANVYGSLLSSSSSVVITAVGSTVYFFLFFEYLSVVNRSLRSVDSIT